MTFKFNQPDIPSLENPAEDCRLWSLCWLFQTRSIWTGWLDLNIVNPSCLVYTLRQEVISQLLEPWRLVSIKFTNGSKDCTINIAGGTLKELPLIWYIILRNVPRELAHKVKTTIPFMMETQYRLQGQMTVLLLTCHIVRNKARHASWPCSVHLCFHHKRNDGFDFDFSITWLASKLFDW